MGVQGLKKYCSNDNDTQNDNCDINLGIELCIREHYVVTWIHLCVGIVTVFEKCKSPKEQFCCSTLSPVNENSLKFKNTKNLNFET